MRDSHLRRMAANRIEAPCGAAMQLQLRWAAAPDHFDLAPQHTLRMAYSERLHHHFFNSKTPSKMNRRIATAHAVRDLVLGKDAMRKARAITLDGGGDARDVRCVEPNSDDVHASQA